MEWIYSPDDHLLQILGGCVLIFVSIIVLTRVVGLRSFAKFTAYDFAFTVAIGSIISSTLTSTTSIAQGSVAIGGLLFITFAMSYLQRKSDVLKNLVSNQPLLLMKDSTIYEDNLKYARIEKSQLIAKLREANVLNYEQVLAVVLESTGDISVLHKSDSNADQTLHQDLLLGVRHSV